MHRFSSVEGPRFWCRADFPNRLSSLQDDCLEARFSREENNSAVWDCGSDRAFGPHRFSFAFF